VKKNLSFKPLLICTLVVVGFSLAAAQSDPDAVKLHPSGPQTITTWPLNIIAPPDNPGLQCTLCLRAESSATRDGGVEFQMSSHSPTPGNFATHFVANYWAPPDGASLGNFYPVYFATEANGNATWGTYVGAEFDSGNGGGLKPIYDNWEGVHVQLENNTTDGSGVTVPGHLYGLHVKMPGILGAQVSAAVRVDGLTDATDLAFHTPRGTLQTDNGNIIAHTGTVGGKILQVDGKATWTAGPGEPAPDSCRGLGSLYSRTDAPDSSHVLYVCAPEGWVAK
jgi:hypothetical protein